MRWRLWALLACVACSSQGESGGSGTGAVGGAAGSLSMGGSGAGDGGAAGGGSSGGGAGGSSGANCTSLAGNEIVLPGQGPDGAYDPSLAHEPGAPRVWLSYSSVDGERISTHLAYSDDGGLSWCEQGVVNASSPAEPPAEYAGYEAFWNHEVSRVFFDPSAPSAERWKLVWHRYLYASDGSTGEARRFQYGWLSLKAAQTPAGLLGAPERKWLAGAGYDLTSAIKAYNDGVLGPPEVRLDQQLPELGDCVAFTEPGPLGDAAGLTLALLCGGQTSRLVVLREAGGAWSYLGEPVGASQAAQINPAVTGFSAPDLFESSGKVWLAVSPTVGNAYAGCVGYEIDPTTGALVTGAPGFAVAGDASSFQSGVCSFDSAATATGMWFGEVFLDPRRFTLRATHQVP